MDISIVAEEESRIEPYRFDPAVAHPKVESFRALAFCNCGGHLGQPIQSGRDLRWQAIIELGEYIRSDPEAVWALIAQSHDTCDEDLRAALATCLLEHLLEDYPDFRARAEQLASRSPAFARMLQMCW